MNLLLIIKVCDDDGKVVEETFKLYDGSWGFEVEKMFHDLGRQFAKKVDPGHD